MRISDWSSDVCSSDLELPQVRPQPQHRRSQRNRERDRGGRQRRASLGGRGQLHRTAGGKASGLINEGDLPRSDRKSVVSGKSVSVRLDLGGRRSIKKNNKQYPLTHHYPHTKTK